jgi:O-antigen/teichoic acid export membrane protein
MPETSLSSGIRWTGVSMLGLEVSRIVFLALVARLIGPKDFGIAAQATVYIGIVSLIIDLGFSGALIQRKELEPELPGVIVSINLAIGAAATALTIAIAPIWASFMHTPALGPVLMVLAADLFIRSIAITPRAMLIRNMRFRALGITDATAAVCGGVMGLAVALTWPTYWAVVVQTIGTDAVMLMALFALGAMHRPNRHLRYFREIASFSWRVFVASALINSVSRNIDNLLIGRFQGAEALAFYSLAYRLLLLPVQLATSAVTTVFLPLFSRLADNVAVLSTEMTRATRTLAALSLPAMALVAAAAPQLVSQIFGSEWSPAIPIVQVLAIVGAVQAIYHPTTAPLVVGVGRATLVVRYAWLITTIACVGIVAGLPFGPLGVAFGYAAATGLLLPVEWLIRRHLLGITIRSQIASLLPGCHVALWVVAAYLLVAVLIPGNEAVVLGVGVLVASACGAAVLRLTHRALSSELLHMTNQIIGRESPRRDSSEETSSGNP